MGKQKQNLEILINLTSEQADYILQYLMYPSIPMSKDLETKTTITDQIASAKQKAIYNNQVKQKAHVGLEIIAKFIIAKNITGRELFQSPDEVRNILQRTIDCQIIPQKITDKHFEIVINNPKITPHLFLVRYNHSEDKFQIWDYATHWGKKWPWLDCTQPRPYLEFSRSALEEMIEE